MTIYYGGATEINLCHSRYAFVCNAIHWRLEEKIERGNKKKGALLVKNKRSKIGGPPSFSLSRSLALDRALCHSPGGAHLQLVALLILGWSLCIHEAEIEM